MINLIVIRFRKSLCIKYTLIILVIKKLLDHIQTSLHLMVEWIHPWWEYVRLSILLDASWSEGSSAASVDWVLTFNIWEAISTSFFLFLKWHSVIKVTDVSELKIHIDHKWQSSLWINAQYKCLINLLQNVLFLTLVFDSVDLSPIVINEIVSFLLAELHVALSVGATSTSISIISCHYGTSSIANRHPTKWIIHMAKLSIPIRITLLLRQSTWLRPWIFERIFWMAHF